MDTFIKFFLVGSALLLFGLISYISSSDLTNNEAGMLSILLVILATLSTWIITHFYSQAQHKSVVDEVRSESRKNLETYAIQAAEKVTSLSDELDRLAIYLGEEREQEYDNPENELSSKKEKIASAIHIIGTLKSNNDNALSDWRGVIPVVIEDIEDQKEDLLEKQAEELREQTEFYTSLFKSHSGDSEDQTQDEIDKKVKILNLKITRMIRDSNKIKVRTSKTKLQKEQITRPCPFCKKDITYRQRPLSGSIKRFKCEECDTRIVGRWNSDVGFYLNERKDFSPEVQITEEMISQAKKLLPPQPWPSGVHRMIAKELNISTTKATVIIQRLIKVGEVHNQIDGKIQHTSLHKK